jgi:hypothetical protein
MPVMDTEVTIKRFVVYTTNENPNMFQVFVSDLPRIVDQVDNPSGYKKPDEFELMRFSLKRALFIEQAIQEKLDREKSQ